MIAHGQPLVLELTLLQKYTYWNPTVAHGQSFVRELTLLLKNTYWNPIIG